MKIKLLFCALFALLFVACSDESTTNKTTVTSLDLNKFMGSWYEIARYDHSFERGLVGCKANYSFKDDGTIKVLNTGYKNTLDGKYDEAEGKARRPNENEPGKLEVAFFANFYADYFVYELDEDYTYALIGSSKDKYLWVLCRNSVMEPEDLDFIKTRILDRGYSLDDLIWVEQ